MAQGAVGGSLQALMDDIDDWCGTPPHPGPRRPGLNDLLVGIAIAELATRIGHEDTRKQVGQLATGLIQQAQKQVGAGG